MTLYYKIRNAIRDFWWDFRRRCQRFKRGYAYSDVWDIDCWFIDTIKPMLIHLRDYGIGIPWDLYNHEDKNERIDWENILTEMVECLDLMNEDAAQKYLCISNNDHSFESYQKVNNLMDEKKNRFFELFSKYFFSLWD